MNNESPNNTLSILSVNISSAKGTIKKPVEKIILDREGVHSDAHAGKWHRQVSLLGTESITKFEKEAGRSIRYGEFAENITTRGMLLYKMHPLDILANGEIRLEVTQIGKKCHGDNCSIFREVGNCVMPKEGIFARVLRGGEMMKGDTLEYMPHNYRAVIITLSDRASAGEYKDISGGILEKRLREFHSDKNMLFTPERQVIPDDAEILKNLILEAVSGKADYIFTTGGTGIGPRDITPDVIRPMFDKEIPGIMEHIRLTYGSKHPAALLSRSVAGVIGQTQVYTLPGSPKAVEEYLTEILRVLGHATLMVHGLGH
jgi:molybdopterin adenylyltransferase